MVDHLSDDQIRAFFARPEVHIQVAAEGDGGPEIARGDTFIFARDAGGAPRKMPFATIVTKDYPGFDEASRLDARGLSRLNLEVGREVFTRLFGFVPSALEEHRDRFDFGALDRVIPHPVYGAYGWVSVIAPSHAHAQVEELMRVALERALGRERG